MRFGNLIPISYLLDYTNFFSQKRKEQNYDC